MVFHHFSEQNMCLAVLCDWGSLGMEGRVNGVPSFL
jgi:hypothetical protein